MKKLKDNKGITIIHALVGLIIFMVIGSVIFGSAQANLKDYNRQKSYQQAYMTVSSAANTFIDSIKGDAVEYIERQVDMSEEGAKTPIYEAQPAVWNFIDSGLTNPFVATASNVTGFDLLEAFKIQKANPETKLDYQFIINASSDAYNVRLQPVLCDIKIRQFAIYANFYIVEESGGTWKMKSGVDNYIMSAVIPMIDDYFSATATPYSVNTNDIFVDATGKWRNMITTKYRFQYDTANIKIYKGITNID